MYLKNLTALGFKSFADKTALNFLPGVSAIVGPNGCGKSNISDAIRWVLGEQSAKALRGGEMADVIFNGTDGRKPLGMAEVSLTIGDVDHEQLRAAGVEIGFNEVTITRRVFRDGGSEYFINKTPCRLKDIQQLFMGTGVGRTSYSIMAQGNITQILSSKPEDRRLVFEEAAGITKYKAQKRETLRKLESTEQNLLRVADLIKEVKRQIGSLQRQAGKARRYKQLMLDLQHLDTQLARHQFDLVQTDVSEKSELIEKLRLEIELASEGVSQTENQIGQLRGFLSTLEQEIHETENRAHELKSQLDRHESQIQFNQERLKELETQNAKASSDITQAEERQLAAEQEQATVSERLASANQALDQHRQTLQTRRDSLQQVEHELSRQQDALRQTQNEAFSAAQQLTRVRNEITALDLQKQGNMVRIEKLSSEKIQLEEERTRLEALLQDFSNNVEAEKQHIQMSRGSVEERQQRLREVQEQLIQATKALDAVLQQQTENRSRLNLLDQLQSDYEGFSAGTLAALKGTQRVLGSLTDKLRVPDQYITAVEAALGHNLQLVLTERPESAQDILSDLSANKKGRASIAVLDFCSSHKAQTNGHGPPPANATAATSILEGDPAVQPLLNRLLDSTYIVPELSNATAAWFETQGQYDFVTLQGELLSRHGIFTGGSGNGAAKTSASALGRKNQIAELRSLVARLQEKIEEASRHKGALQSEQMALQTSLQQAQNELRTQEVAMATSEGEFKALQTSLRTLHQKIDTVVYEIQSLAEQEQEVAQQRAVLGTQISQLESRDLALQQQASEASAALENLREQRDAANSALTEVKVALASEEQLSASFRQQHQSLEHRLQELAQLLENRRSETASFVTRRAQFESEIEQAGRRIDSLQQDRGLVNARLGDLTGQKEVQEQQIATREEDLREKRRAQSELQQRRGGLEVELAQKQMALENLRQRIMEKYQVRLEDVRSECITITIATEGPSRIHTLTPEEMAASGAATDWTAVAEQVAALQRRIDEMGPVNLVAIEEYEETEQRYQFLSAQHDDLVQAKQQLLEVINRINAQTKEMFSDTFNRIRENFRAMFVEIFGGGKADLVLVDEGDVLESGIDIVARPPGKQLQSISLLSGGEQTMTAVALLFSIYQVKPSPFCVLDELDAPLDESNINRFIRILQRFLDHSQFIIITHNKRTIGMADALYGVTMEEHGVSKIVSVKFHKSEEPAPSRTAPLLDTPLPGPLVEEEEDREQPSSEMLEVVMAK
jgi:chromosome segregation protein